MTKEKIFSVFSLGLLVGIMFTSLTQNVRSVDASKKKPTPTPVPSRVAGFYQDLTGAILDQSFLAYHDFSGFVLTNASLRSANLSAANFDAANLDGVDFTGANLSNMSHAGATFVGSKWYSCPEGEGQCGATTCPDGTTILSTDGAVCF